jgi:hypothetical protein
MFLVIHQRLVASLGDSVGVLDALELVPHCLEFLV